MPLQNRVDPFGAIQAVPQRGLFTGNRGIIHDPDSRTLLKRRWSTRAWITCTCEFRGRRREVMGRNARGGGAGWTELFFLDEVTALAAGHRPCFTCRREDAKRFAACFTDPPAGAPQMDAKLHRERLASGGRPQRLGRDAVAGLPDGVVIAAGEQAFATRGGLLLPWSFAGYAPAVPLTTIGVSDIRLLTPPSTVAALRNGYRPVWHTSAASP